MQATVFTVNAEHFDDDPRNFYGSIGSGMGSTQPRDDNWVSYLYEKQQNPVKKPEIKFQG